MSCPLLESAVAVYEVPNFSNPSRDMGVRVVTTTKFAYDIGPSSAVWYAGAQFAPSSINPS